MNKSPLHNLPEETAEDLYENAPFGYISFLADGTIFRTNRTLQHLLGYEQGELAQNKKIQSLFTIGGRIYFETHFFPLIRMQGFVKEVNLELKKKDGGTFPALLNVNQFSSSNGQSSSFRASVIDITDRKKYEKVLLESKERAEKASRAKAEFLSTISHEIRTPLNAIVGIGNLLQKTPLNELQKEYARILQLSSQNLLELVNNLLDLSKIDAQKVKVEKRTFSLKNLLDLLMHSFKIKASEKGIQFISEYQEKLPNHLIGDPVKLNQVLTNLIGNAIKFTGTGYVKLNVDHKKAADGKILLQFAVLDTGIGIPENKLQAIFEEFSQASYDVNLEYGGTGLGLTISQKLLQMHGSELKVESEEGKGSKFSFDLEYSLAKKAPKEIKRIRAAEIANAPLGRILVVDDNNINLFIIARYLQEWKMDYTTVNSGQAAIDEVQKKHYDLVLMDLHMPKMDGYETSRKIQDLELEKKPAIIALSASGRGDLNLKMKRAGIYMHVPKPFDPVELHEIILDLLQKETECKPSKEPAKNNTLNTKSSFSLNRLQEVSKQNEEIFQKLITNSLRSITEYKKDFNAAAAAGDEKRLDVLIHKNKMSLHYIQAEKLSEAIATYRANMPPQDSKDSKNSRKKEILHEFDCIILKLEAAQAEDIS